jgi:hypothetical protein
LRAAILFFILTTALRAEPIAPPQVPAGPPTGPTERIEAGRAHLPSGADVVYRIRLLPLASFPALPAAVSGQLQQKDCMVPQTYAARGPENVIRGAFEKKGSDDWAVLCSVNGATTLYVFLQSRPEEPVMLRHQPDWEWLGSEAVGAYGSAWGISRRSPSQIRSSQLGRKGEVIDHDGIEDAFIEHSSSVHYFQNGEWGVLEPRD